MSKRMNIDEILMNHCSGYTDYGLSETKKDLARLIKEAKPQYHNDNDPNFQVSQLASGWNMAIDEYEANLLALLDTKEETPKLAYLNDPRVQKSEYEGEFDDGQY